ncbi:MAG: hypothetical protein K2X82_30610 [Gemmataceae bacterium]|nr:hypothetical protein [Gemmataceae bacterium]
MTRLCLPGVVVAAVLCGPAVGRADELADLRKKVERLEAENEALKDQLVKLKKELAEARGKPAGGAAKTLSDRLAEGAVLKGDAAITNMGKDNFSGKATLTINERKDNTFKATFRSVAEGKPDFEHEVTGTITGTNVAMKSVSPPNPFTLNGSYRDDYLSLQFTGPITKAKVKLKVE